MPTNGTYSVFQESWLVFKIKGRFVQGAEKRGSAGEDKTISAACLFDSRSVDVTETRRRHRRRRRRR